MNLNYGKRGVREKQKELNARGVKWTRKFEVSALQLFLVAILSICVIGLCAGIGVFRGVIATSPDISHIDVSPTGYSTFVYDTAGNQIAKLVSTNSNRIPVTIEQVDEDLQHAFVAIEDSRFYEHSGIDIKGIIRAFYEALKSRDLDGAQGASTITQQLIKNNVFTDWTSETSFSEKLKRKIQEQYLALELEKVMSKDEILENYLNTINLGQNTLGVQAACLRYFNKPASDLTISEAAVIAAITQNPSRYNPISHPDKNATRREKVLNDMLEQGYISQEEWNVATADDVYSRIQLIDSETEDDTINSYFVDALTEDVMEDLLAAGYNDTQAYTLLYSGGLKIYSTQDPNIQGICDSVFNDESNYPENVKLLLSYELTTQDKDGNLHNYSSENYQSYFKEQNSKFNMIYASSEDAQAGIDEYKAHILETEGGTFYDETISLTLQPQVSLTVEDQSTGYIVAMVGGRGPKKASRTLNRATGVSRQPGSTFKVVSTYAPALDSAGMTLATVQLDAPFNYDNGRPVGNWYDTGYRGICSIRDGIRDSLNIIAVKTLTVITPSLGYDYLINFGFTTLESHKVIGDQVFSDITQALALGGITNGVKNIELNAAYACIANGGIYNKPKLYTKIADHDGNVIIDNSEPESKRVIKETTAFLLTSAMQDVITSGTATSVNFGNMAIAGKTGTTSDYNDVWFSGYTPYYTATTWTGYDNNVKLSSKTEKALAKTLWKACMSRIHENLEYQSFPIPDGIVTATVCAKSGKLPIAGLCDAHLKTEYFDAENLPTETCDVHYQGAICAYDGCMASDECPFKVDGILELLPTQDPSLISGSSTIAEDGTIIDNTQNKRCHHDATFFAQPNYQEILAQEQAEMAARNAAAQAAADQAAQEAAQQAAQDAGQ
ncbi:MAG: transglycosylase domain-containing protein [Lachnospiraceae bacterium]|nr:transglycosylase domain-containing protein [Lachnospiraceae bacterium]